MAEKDEDDNREPPGDDDNIGHGELSAARKMPSKLIRHTLKKFAWGVVSAQEAQQIAECSKKDFDNFKKATSSQSGSQRESLMRPTTTHPIEKDLSSVASIGAQGQYSNKCYVDLMKTVEANMTLPLPHRERMRFKAPLGEQVQEILLPHEFFAAHTSMMQHSTK